MRKLLGMLAVVCGFLSLGVFLPTIASATLIYDNGVPSSGSTGGTDITGYFLAEDFTLTQAVTLTSIRFWNLQGFPATCCYDGSITWGIYSNNNAPGGAKPGVPLAGPTNTIAVTRTPLIRPGSDEFQNDVVLPSVPLSAGTYWLALHNGPLTRNSGDPFYWEFSGSPPAGGSPGRICNPSPTVDCTNTADWGPYSNTEYAFQLYGEAGVVPEPSTLLLMGFALPGLAGVSIHRRRKPSNC